jgi:putative membrane protein
MKQNKILKNILYIIQGAIVGIGAILPGVSGGVLCVAFGIYEPMMELLTNPRDAIKKSYKMFIPFIIGWVLGFLLLARAIEILFAKSAAVALMLFFGLICGTLPELFKISEKSDPTKSWTPFVISLSAAYLMFHILEGQVGIVIPPSFLSFLLCGFFWGLSLIVPGLSSSSILICLGLYEPLTSGIAALDPGVLIPMAIGIVLTALALARLVNMLFKKHYAVTSRAVLGFVIASALKAIPTDFGNTTSLLVSIICFVLGFAVALAMDRYKQKDIQGENS